MYFDGLLPCPLESLSKVPRLDVHSMKCTSILHFEDQWRPAMAAYDHAKLTLGSLGNHYSVQISPCILGGLSKARGL
jgi:hypothetical protein